MKKANEIGFPAVGEVIHFLFKAAGVLSDKRGLTPGTDDTQRGTVRKMLERLAKEEGNLHDQIGEAIKELSFLVTGYVNHAAFSLAIGEVVMDMIDVYKYVIADEGTYLSRHDTLRWMLTEHWVPAAAFSVAKQVTKFGLRAHSEYFPDDERWYLPDFSDERPIWPLAKVMRWIYARADTSQTQFHYPDRKVDAADDSRERDLQNAQNWIHGRYWPSAADLDWTFKRAFASHSLDDSVTATYRDASCIALFLARCISTAASAVQDEFGKEFLVEMCEKFERTFAIAQRETRAVELRIGDLAEKYAVSSLDPRLRSDVVMQWCRELQHRTHLANTEIQDLYEKGKLDAAETARLARSYGDFLVLPAFEQLRSSENRVLPQGFIDALGRGMTLSKDQFLADKSIGEYEADLRLTGMERLLPWMVPWLRFQVCYRQRDDANAWIWIQKAFEAARYRAGRRQYAIVNHYVELAAKKKDVRKFKGGVNWANYLGIEIRWLRDKEPNRENLEDTMQMMSLARYRV
jgi:hypothetical protein